MDQVTLLISKAECPIMMTAWLEDSCLGSMSLPLLKAMEGAATQCTHGVNHGQASEGTYACNLYAEGLQ